MTRPKKAAPTPVNGVTYYPIKFDRNLHEEKDRCTGCHATNKNSTDLSDIRCATVSASSERRCFSIIWKTGDEGLAIWTAERLTE